MKIKNKILTLVFIVNSIFTYAQTESKDFTKNNYFAIIEKLNFKLNDGSKLSSQESLELGYSYYNTSNYRMALPYLLNIENPISSDKLLFKIAHSYKAVNDTKNGNNFLKKLYQNLNIDYDKNLNDLSLLEKIDDRYTIKKLNKANSKFSEIYNYEDENFIYFSSNQTKNSKSETRYKWNNDYYYNQYTLSKKDSSSTKLNKINTDYHDSGLILSKDKKIGFYVSNLGNKTDFLTKDQTKSITLKIYQLFYDEKGNIIRKIILPFNSGDYSCKNPFFDDNTNLLYFSSNMKKENGYDIYSFRIDSQSDLKNISSINSIADEDYIFIDELKNIYFTSDGYFGFGGKDIFKSKFNSDTSKFERVMNIGKPINTNGDDFGFSIHDKKGFYTSNFSGNDDIYSFVEIKDLDLDRTTQIVKGSILDDKNNIIKDITFDLQDIKTKEILALNSNSGNFEIELTSNSIYEITIKSDDYELITEKIKTDNEKFIVKQNDIKIMKSPCETTFKGNIYDLVRKNEIVGLQVYACDLRNNVFNKILTDEKGNYSFSVPCNQNIVFRSKYDSDNPIYPSYQEYMKTSDKRETIIKNIGLKEVKSKGLLVNEKGELLVETNPIYFDSGKFLIKEESKVELQKVLDILNYSKTYKLIINSHTDNKGTVEKNQILSENRAKTTFNYFLSKGISKDRMSYFGFNSSKPLIECVPCSTLELSKNRRSEFVLIE
jgi:outer membrane protein OmpA-like peptidoglycan-associated protein